MTTYFLKTCATGALGALPTIALYVQDKQALSDPRQRLDPCKHLDRRVAQITERVLGDGQQIILIKKEPCDDPAEPSALGNICLLGKGGICIDPKWAESMILAGNRAELEFILAHEIHHTKHNDRILIPASTGATAVITKLALDFLMKPSSGLLAKAVKGGLKCSASLSVGLGTWIAVAKYTEKQADLGAFSVCPRKTTREHIAYYQRSLKENQLIREAAGDTPIKSVVDVFGIHVPLPTMPLRRVISEKGNWNIDVFHPLLTERVAYLEKALATTPKKN